MQNLENKNLDDSCCSYESYEACRKEDNDSDFDSGSEDETFSLWSLEEKETINGVTFQQQLAAKITFVYPTKAQRAIDEQTTGFKNIPIIRYSIPDFMDEDYMFEKLSKQIYIHCVLGQEVMFYPVLRHLKFEIGCNFSCYDFTGDDGLRYTSLVIREMPRYNFARQYCLPEGQQTMDEHAKKAHANSHSVCVKKITCQCHRRHSWPQISVVGHQMFKALGGEFPFNNLTSDMMNDPNEAQRVMERISVYYGGKAIITLEQVARCVKEKERYLKAVKTELQKSEDDWTYVKDDKPVHLMRIWDEKLIEANTIKSKIEKTLLRKFGETAKQRMKSDVKHLCWSNKGSIKTKLGEVNIYKPLAGGEELSMRRLLNVQNRLMCLVTGVEPSAQDDEPQIISVKDRHGAITLVNAEQWEAY